MKIKIVALLWIMSAFVAMSAAADSFPSVTVEKISDRVYAMLGPYDVPNKQNRGYINNVLVIIGDDGVILVDAGSHKSVARHIDRAIKTVTDKPVTHILVTHHHTDHHLGAEYFSGARVIGTEFCADQITNYERSMIRGMERLSGVDLSGANAVVPEAVIGNPSHKSMEINGVRVELIAPDIAHTKGDLMVWLPDDAVLASGDILVNRVNPNFNDGSLKNWIAVVNEEILPLDFNTVMPGHGPLMKREDVTFFRDLITDFYQTVEKIYLADGLESDVRNNLDLSTWQSYTRFEDMMGRNINKVWLQVEEANF
jgi:glyoxylase-like metal-dependent hydrolase (beta-lactamase superfamily II)